jgi:predicted dehydrogenase
MGELRLCLDQDYQNASYVTRYVAPGDGELINFQPGSGIAMGYDDLKVIEAHRLVQSIATGQSVGATIHDALKAAEIIDAMAESAASRTWIAVHS